MSDPASRSPARQMVFDLARPPSFDPDDFLVSGSNVDAHAAIMRWPHWPARTLLLLGPAGCGKSHLAAIWAGLAGASTLVQPSAVPTDFVGPAIALLEDGDRRTNEEVALFHLLNLIEETNGWLVITARKPPDLWRVRTPDLLSRLRRAPIISVGNPDAALVRAVLVKLFHDRQIRIDADIVGYAALHCDQSLEAAARFVAAVDDAALVEGRRITRKLAAQTLDALRSDAD